MSKPVEFFEFSACNHFAFRINEMKHQNYITGLRGCIQKACLLISTFIIIASPRLFAQNVETSTADNAQIALEKVVSLYDKQIGRNSIIYTGSGYYDPFKTLKENQFFIDEYWEFGSVVYDGFTFDSIYLMYDIYQDLLLIENFNSSGFLSPIKLYSPKVESFRLHGYHFIRLESDSIFKIKEGFYNLMYSGDDLQVLIKRIKVIVNANEINSIQEEFRQKDKYYIKKGKSFYQVKNIRSILKVLSDRKKEVKTFIKNNNIIFKDNPDIQLVEVAKYYDSLN